MKAIAWVFVAIIQVSLFKWDLLKPLQGVSNLLHSAALNFIEAHPSRWNWFYEGILIGADESFRSRPSMESFFTLGLYHLLVGAGCHVMAVEWMTTKATFFIPEKPRRLLIGLVLLSFAMVNRLQASCMRALIQWIFVQSRRRSPLPGPDLLMVVTCFCLLVQPSWAMSFSFQLSCGAALALAMASSLRPRRMGKFFSRLFSSFLCSTVTAPLIFCIQPCLSWIIIPANTFAMPVFTGMLIPLSMVSVVFRPIAFLTDFCCRGIFAVAQFAAHFEKPLLCLDERKLRICGIFYIAGLYFFWRLLLPFFIQRRFWTAQQERGLKLYSGT